MRRIALIAVLLALAVPVVAQAGSGSGTGSGTTTTTTDQNGALAVQNAYVSKITLQGRGLVYGRIGQGTLTVIDYQADDGDPPQISGAPYRLVGASQLVTKYTGSNIRFLFTSGRYSLKFEGSKIAISAVGKGSVAATGAGTKNDGTLTLNGGKPQPLGGTFALQGSFGPDAPGTSVGTVTVVPAATVKSTSQ
jgi:hypothetical protein